ncbi:hypothetical protein ZIOFF_056625 [Zingiber officinale]|uniref:C2H2-type domain-containing protein n=1 Tax=Zingiber officinale TaxID=94328 RepID=A0A8J5FH62_ZINOF|nr:hypothetical protein ZIOFF_056625 [Zingiber officinale]
MEGDRHGEEASSGDDDADAGTRPHPYYGCTFCKRGFSNAQALGGHMNIHRKDRAKAVAPPPPAVPSSPERGVDQGYYYGCYGDGQSAYSPLSSSARRLLGEDLSLLVSLGAKYSILFKCLFYAFPKMLKTGGLLTNNILSLHPSTSATVIWHNIREKSESREKKEMLQKLPLRKSSLKRMHLTLSDHREPL